MTQIKVIASLLLSIWISLAMAASSHAAETSGYATGDIAIGDKNAPVTIIEYASMTCPHCASFHNDTFKQLKESYIDTGKVRMIFREFPFDAVALRASMLARCSGPDRAFSMISVLFRQQAQWTSTADPVAELRKLARLSGMSDEAIDTCLSDQALADSILETRLRANKEFEVDSTPSFIVNGTKYSGALPMAKWNEILGDLLN